MASPTAANRSGNPQQSPPSAALVAGGGGKSEPATTTTSTALAASSSSSNTSTNNKGCLQVTILSAYDLPRREPPLYVSVTVGGGDSNNRLRSARTGPPVQRHKDRNSFKFSNTDHLNDLRIDAPLAELYNDAAVVEVAYPSNPSPNNSNSGGSGGGNSNSPTVLRATYALDRLRIHETTWLILHLDDDDSGRAVTAVTTATDGTSGNDGGGADNGGSGNDSFGDDDGDGAGVVAPTLRLQMTLHGPYRTEIGALVKLAEAWFGLVDGVQGGAEGAAAQLPSLPASMPIDPKWLLLPAVPVAAVAVVTAPVVAGVMTVGLPLFLPAFALAGLVGIAASLAVLGAYCSTSQGRSQLQGLLGPVAHTVLSTRSGQTLVYQTGPRPSPVAVARTVLPNDLWGRLAISLLIDLVGSSSYLIPLAGEAFDVTWAPFQTILIMAMYDDVAPNLKYISFVEEILPFTDIVPSATMGWLTEFGLPMLQDQMFGKIHLNTPPTPTRSGPSPASTPQQQAAGGPMPFVIPEGV